MKRIMRPAVLRRVGVFVLAALMATMLAVVSSPAPVAADEAPPVFDLKWGTFGRGDGQFRFPRGVAVDSTGNVYVADQGNHRVQKFTSTGTFVTKWGTEGGGDGQFFYPGGVAVDSTGNVYVADEGNNRVQKFTSTGTFVTKWGTEGDGDGQFDGPQGVAVDSRGNVYVADTYNSRVQKFTSTGTFVTKWGTNDLFGGDGQFASPLGVAVDGSGNVYVADFGNNRVQKFTSAGVFVTKWGTYGGADGQFKLSTGVAVDSAGNVYVSDADNSRIQKFGSVASPRPDGRIKNGAGAFVGDDVYNTTGDGQTRYGRAARGSTVTYTVKAQNDSTASAVLRLEGTATATSFKVTYTVGGTDVTAGIVAGAYTTPELTPGAKLTVIVTVKVKSTAPPGASLTGSLTAKSDTDPATEDTVKFVTRRA